MEFSYFRILKYILEHPRSAIGQAYYIDLIFRPKTAIKRFLPTANIFINSLLDTHISISEISYMDSSHILKKIILDSMAPRSGDMPIDPLEAISVYLLVKVLKPETVIETGVSAGRSSGFILQALNENNKGYLYSIDPNPNVGWAIPKHLKYRWKLLVGTSREILPKLIKKLPKVDVFLHDSLHTYENMYFEYKTIWPTLREGGILLSDDTDWNTAFEDFSKEVKCKVVHLTKSFAGIKKC